MDALACYLDAPCLKHTTVASHRIGVLQGIATIIMAHLPSVQEPISSSDTQDGVVCTLHLGLKELKVLRLDVVKLVDASYDVSNNCS